MAEINLKCEVSLNWMLLILLLGLKYVFNFNLLRFI
jgi:hypothetical protein